MSVGEISVIIKLCEAIPKQNILCNRTWLASFGVSQTSHALFPNSGVSDCFRNFTGSTWRKQSRKLKNGWWKMDLSIIAMQTFEGKSYILLTNSNATSARKHTW